MSEGEALGQEGSLQRASEKWPDPICAGRGEDTLPAETGQGPTVFRKMR